MVRFDLITWYAIIHCSKVTKVKGCTMFVYWWFINSFLLIIFWLFSFLLLRMINLLARIWFVEYYWNFLYFNGVWCNAICFQNEKATLETNKANELVSWLAEERKVLYSVIEGFCRWVDYIISMNLWTYCCFFFMIDQKWEREKHKLQEKLKEKEEDLASSQAFNQVLIVKLNEHNAELHQARHSLIMVGIFVISVWHFYDS